MTSSNYKLLMQVSSSKFSFVTKNILTHEVTYFGSEAITNQKSIEDQLQSIFEKYSQLSWEFNEIVIYHDNPLNTFVPQELFDQDNLSAYLQYNTKVFASDFFDHDYIESLNIHNVYLPYTNLNNFFLDKFGSFTYKNINTELVDILVCKTQDTEQICAFSFLNKDRFELIIAQKGGLLFFNSFIYSNATDFIYYILFTLEQLAIDPQNVQLNLMGRIDYNDSIYKLCYEFIKNTNIISDHAFISADLPLHHQVPKQHYILFHS
ncbi:DUF3822 family protein [Myroides sp. LJL119]